MKTLIVNQIADGSTYDPETEIHTAKYVYGVEKVTNSITPVIGSRLIPVAMEVYCESDEWNVTIK